MGSDERYTDYLIANSDRLLEEALAKAHSKLRLAEQLNRRYQTVRSWYQGVKPSLESLVEIHAFIEEGREQ